MNGLNTTSELFNFLPRPDTLAGLSFLSLTTVYAVKRFVATLRRRRQKERHFALEERF